MPETRMLLKPRMLLKKIPLIAMLLTSLLLAGAVAGSNPDQAVASTRNGVVALANIPLKKGMSYDEARALILQAGWEPNLAGRKNLRDRRVKSMFEGGYPEIEDCSGTGSAPCLFSFTNVKGEILAVSTDTIRSRSNVLRDWWIKPPQTRPTEPKNVAIDSYTDHFFYAANPELSQRKLRASDKAYIREWNAIRSAIEPLVKSSREVCLRNGDGSLYWEFDLGKDRSSYDILADVIFYHRHPALAGQKLRPQTADAREWSSIRKQMYISTCGI
jgi:hypothetical protein